MIIMRGGFPLLNLSRRACCILMLSSCHQLLGEMSDILQESLTFLVDMMCEHITAAAADLDSIAEVLSSAISATPARASPEFVAW